MDWRVNVEGQTSEKCVFAAVALNKAEKNQFLNNMGF